MKENITVFSCDGCGVNVETVKDSGFPYSKGWVYIYKFEFKFGEQHQQRHIDHHFCSKKCGFMFVKSIFKKEVEC